jgi:hypothetical protein
MRLPALEDNLGDKVEATCTIRIGVVIRVREDLAHKAKSAWVKPEEPGAKKSRPIRARHTLGTDKIKERAFEGVKLQGEGQVIRPDCRVVKGVEGPVALWASSKTRPAPKAGHSQRGTGGGRHQRVDSRVVV